MSEIAIRVEGLGKQYRIGKRERYRTLRDSLTDAMFAPFRSIRSLFGPGHPQDSEASETIWALKDVSFEIPRGEVVGVIGRNGAGKSTLLKILSRITEPTNGCAEIYGRVGSLLEVGTGFHPELTGRENIFLNGAILGMRRAEILRKFDEIVGFAETEKFVDTPVKHYSTGMYLRLAFAVAAHLDPEILVVDEVLAVGDAAFQKKCLGKMNDVAKQGRTILFVSHNMSSIQQLTDRAMLLNKGSLIEYGRTPDVVARYFNLAMDHDTAHYDVRAASRPTWDHLNRDIEFVQFDFFDFQDKLVAQGKPLRFQATVKGNTHVSGFRISLTIHSVDGTPIAGAFGPTNCEVETGEVASFEVTIRKHCLAPGSYYCDFGIGLGNPETGHLDFDVVREVLHFEVMPRKSKDGSTSSWTPAWGSVCLEDIDVRRLSVLSDTTTAA